MHDCSFIVFYIARCVPVKEYFFNLYNELKIRGILIHLPVDQLERTRQVRTLRYAPV